MSDFFPHSDKMKRLAELDSKRQMKKAKAEYDALVNEVLEDEVQRENCYEVGRIE